jgi:hypothetical protein
MSLQRDVFGRADDAVAVGCRAGGVVARVTMPLMFGEVTS